MSEPTGSSRLDSWKAIAEYLKRDVATVRRWEKTVALPVRRMKEGRGHSVFAFTGEIDQWLHSTPTPQAPTPLRARPWLLRAAAASAAIALLVPLVMFARMSIARVHASDIRTTVSTLGLTAFDASGSQIWRYQFTRGYATSLTEIGEAVHIVDGTNPAVFVANTHRIRLSDGAIESGALASLDLSGRLQRSFSFADTLVLAGKTFGPPWGLTAFAVRDDGGRRRIAVAGHHFVWNPGLVTVLDENWNRVGTFVHDGWIESVYWAGPSRLIAGGYSNARGGGVIALLDADHLDGLPLRMVVLPRSEINTATASPFNRVNIQLLGARLLARSIEAPPAGGREAVDAIYEMTTALDVQGAAYGDRYWEMHRTLEAQGKLRHAREQCPDRDGPRTIEVWTPKSGWVTQKIVGPNEP